MTPDQPENPEEPTGFSGDPTASDPPAHASRSRPGDELLGRTLALVRHLREHCPWDARQTSESLRPYLLEEAHETADAILRGEPDEVCGELGDLLLNVAFQVVVAEEDGDFDAREVITRLEAKMRARHPHVYGDAETPPDWEATKRDEREGAAADEVPRGLPPLGRSLRVQQRAASVGFDWPAVRGALEKMREEIAELEEALPEGGEPRDRAPGPTGDGAVKRAPGPGGAEDRSPAHAGGTVPNARLEEEVGDLLFAAVSVARLTGAHPEAALTAATRKFERRFARLQRRAEARDLDPSAATLEELEELWQEVKREEESGPR